MNRVHTNTGATGARLVALAAVAAVAAVAMPCGFVRADSLSGQPSSQPIAKAAMTLSNTAHPHSDLAVVENFLYTLQDLGAMVSARVVLGSAYSQLSSSMRR
ncbi:MAG: hypothetical protein ACYCYO_06850 [Bacilli bacterium]